MLLNVKSPASVPVMAGGVVPELATAVAVAGNESSGLLVLTAAIAPVVTVDIWSEYGV